jgi:hypothetical protein
MISGTVTCPASYFHKMSMVDYTNWKTALPREFYQNSIDARAKNIHVTFDGGTVSIVDDGTGMSLDVMINKLLVLGESSKADGSVGAFGKAKELLYFSWPSWSIRTRDLLVSGSGPNYTIDTLDKSIVGTVSKISVDSDFSRYSFTDVAEKMDTKTKIYIDGMLIQSASHRGRLIKSFDFGDLYLNKSVKSLYMSVRVSGIWMYDHYIGSSCGQLVLELSKRSIDCMTSNRDDLQWQYRNTLMGFVRELIANEKTATNPKPEMIRTVIPGEGKVRVRPEMLEAFLHGRGTVLEVRSGLIAQIASMGHDLNLVKARVANESCTEPDKERLSFLGYKPDFELMYTKKQSRLVKRFMRSKKALTLATVWTEICKQVILDNSKEYMEFTAGFTFDSNAAASIRKSSNGNVAIYLNPNLIGKDGGWSNKVLSRRFLLSEELKDKAVHEVAHLMYDDHNENFVTAMHAIRAKTALNHEIYGRIGRLR